MHNEDAREHKRTNILIRQFVWRLIFGVIVIAAILLISFIITETPVLTNQVAMGQMKNSNDWFVVMAMYQKFVPWVKAIRNVLVSVIAGMIAWSGCNLAKNLNNEDLTT